MLLSCWEVGGIICSLLQSVFSLFYYLLPYLNLLSTHSENYRYDKQISVSLHFCSAFGSSYLPVTSTGRPAPPPETKPPCYFVLLMHFSWTSAAHVKHTAKHITFPVTVFHKKNEFIVKLRCSKCSVCISSNLMELTGNIEMDTQSITLQIYK